MSEFLILESRRSLEAPFPYRYDGVFDRIVRKHFKLAGIENAGIHTLRKTAGALLIQNGVDIYRVSKFLGHSGVGVTERHYVDLPFDGLRTCSAAIMRIYRSCWRRLSGRNSELTHYADA